VRRTERLWKELGGPAAPPRTEAKAVKRRVNAALDADPIERRNHMKRKISYALAIAALVAVLAGSALAVGTHLDAISAFFGGDRAPVEDYLDTTPRSVSDDNYTFTVESSISAGDTTYLVATVKAHNEETRAFLFSREFTDLDTFDIHPIPDGAPAGEEKKYAVPMRRGVWSVSPSRSDDGDSLSFEIDCRGTGGAEALRARLSWMEEGKYIELPVKRAPSVTAEVGATGMGVCGIGEMEAGILTIDRVTLSPLTCSVETSGQDLLSGVWGSPRLIFRMADGSVRTQAQMMEMTDANIIGEEQDGHIYNYRFHEVQDLDKITGIIVFDAEYPLDGSKPRAVEHDAALDPIVVTRTEMLEEGKGYTLPVRELTEKLGGTCEWDAKTGSVTCTYRGVSIVLRAGEETVLVDGKPAETRDVAPGVLNGSLCAVPSVFFDAWELDGFIQRSPMEAGGNPFPYELHDYYIIP